jgi:hypothetical protein
MNEKTVKALRAIISLFSTESYRNGKNDNFYARKHVLKGIIKYQEFLMQNADETNQKDKVIYDDLLNTQRDEVGAKQFLASTVTKKECLYLQKETSKELIVVCVWLLKHDCNHEYGKFENIRGSNLTGDELDKKFEEAKVLQKQLSK